MGAFIAIYILTSVASAEPANPWAFPIGGLLLSVSGYGAAKLMHWRYQRGKKRTRYTDPW